MAHYQPALSKTVLRLMEVIGADAEVVTDLATTWLEIRQPLFDELPVAVQRRVVQLQLFNLGWEVDFDRVEHLRLRPGSPLTLSPMATLERDAAGIVDTHKAVEARFDAAQVEVNLSRKQGTVRFGRLRITWEIEAGRQTGPLPHPSVGGESFDADKVGSTIALRHWRPGDRFQPIGMRASAKLQDLFGNLKVPRAQRHRLVVATTASGELFWVEGLRMSERFKLDKTTVRRLNWGWKNLLR
jgi:tRNA(Ile)-lysidine synthase